MRLLSSLLLAAVISGLLSLATASADQPLSKDDIALLLLASSPSSKIAQMVEQRGIDFQMDADLAKKFRDQGASDDLIDTLRKAGNKAATAKVSAPAPVPSALSTAAGTSNTPGGPQPSLSGQPNASLFGSAAQQSPGTIAPSSTALQSATPGADNGGAQSDSQPVHTFRIAVRHLFDEEKFDELEAIAAKARSQKERFLGGAWKLYVFYTTIQGPGSLTSTDAVWTAHLERLRRWIGAKPESITPRVALAQAYLRFAWKARGEGYRDTVTSDGWKLFGERVQQARETLENAEKVSTKDPQWYSDMQAVALAQRWNRSQADDLLQKASDLEPKYFYFYSAHAYYLLPKWYGKPGDAETFAQTIADRLGGPDGDLVYFEIALIDNCCNAKEQMPDLSWDRIKEGFGALEQLYGSTNYQLNAVAFMAARQRDSEFAQQIFGRIGDNWDETVWGSKAEFDWSKASFTLSPDAGTGTQGQSPAMNRRRFTSRFSLEAIAFSPDGRSLATVAYVAFRPDGPASPTPADRGYPAPTGPLVVVWDFQSGRIRQRLAGHALGVTSLAFSPNSRWLAAGNQDSTVKVWDTVAGNELHTLRGHTTAIDAVAFSPDGNLASVSIDGVLKLWDPATGSELQALPLGGPIQSATFSPDGSLLATRSMDSADTTIKLWDAADGRQLRAIPAGAGSAMAFSPDRLLLSQADQNAHAIRLFEVATGREVSRLDFDEPVIPQRSGLPEPNQVAFLAFSPNGRWLAGSVANVLHIHIWEVNSGRDALRLPVAVGQLMGSGESASPRGVAFSPDSQWLATTGEALFHVATPRALPGGRSELTLFSGNTVYVSELAFLGDGHTLALVSGGDVRLWDASTGQTIETVLHVVNVGGSPFHTRKFAFSPDGHWLATADPYAGDSLVRLWDLKAAKELRTFTISAQANGQSGFASLAFSADGHLLAMGGFKKIEVWDVDTGRELRTLVTAEDPTPDVGGMDLFIYCVTSLAFSPDGRHLVAVANRSLQLWDSITGQRLADLPAPGFDALMKTDRSAIPPNGPAPPAQGKQSAHVTQRLPQFFASALLSPDGRWLAALRSAGEIGQQENQLVLYDAATLHEVRSLSDFSPDSALLSFSADGRELAAIGQPLQGSDTMLKVWDTSTGQLLRTLPLYHGLVGAMALSNDWQWLAAVPQQGEVPQMQTSVEVWEVSTGRPVHKLAGLPVRSLRSHEPPLQAQGSAPDYPPTPAEVLFSGILARSNARVRDAAILRYQQALNLTPNDPELHFKLGAEFEARAAAAATSSGARPPGPDLPEAARKDYDSALEQYRLAHQLAPDNPRYMEAFERLSRLLKRP